MRHRTTVVLFTLFLAGLCVLWWADYAEVPTREKRAELLNRLLPELIDVTPADVRRVAIDRGPSGGGRLVVERREGGRWQLTEPVDTAAESSTVETLIRNLKGLRRSPDVGTIEGDPGPYGLATPSATVSVYGTDAKTPVASLALGKVARDKAYVRPGGSAGIEAVDARLLSALTLPVKDWRDTVLVRLPSFQVGGVAVREANPAREVAVERGERKWRLVRPFRAPADDDKVEGLVAEVSALRVADFVKDDVRDLAGFGLDAPAMTVEVTPLRDGGPPQFVYFGKAVPGEANQVYARRGDQDDVVRVDVKRLREATPGPNGLRSQTVLDFAPQRVDRVRVDARGTVFDLALGSAGWELLSPARERAEAAAVRATLGALAGLKASEFLDASAVADPHFDAPSFRVRLWQPGAGRAESAAAGPPALPADPPQVDLVLGRHDASRKTVYGRLAGDPTVLALPDTFLDDLPATLFAFRDRTILSAKPEEFARVRVERGGSAVTVEPPGPDAPPGKWVVVEPVKAPADNAAVTALLLTLSQLRAERWVSDRVGDGKKYGLDAPAVRVKWTLQGAKGSAGSGAQGVLRVGGEVPRSRARYANLEGDPRVFSLAPGVVPPLEAELHDPTVLSFKPALAERLMLAWPSRSLLLTAAPGAGSAAPEWRAEPGYDTAGYDIGRVASLVAGLSALKTPKFVQYRGPLPESAGLAHPRITIRVTLAGGEGVRTLRIGNSLSPDTFAATTAEGDEGPVFALPANPAWVDLLRSPRRLDDLPEEVFAPGPPDARPPVR